MEKVVYFSSNQRELLVPLAAIKNGFSRGGTVTSKFVTPGSIRFKNWGYSTGDAKKIAYLRGIIKSCISQRKEAPFWEIPEGQPVKRSGPTAARTAVVNSSAKTVNDIIAHLALDYGVPANDMRGKSIDDLVIFAKSTYNITYSGIKKTKLPAANDGQSGAAGGGDQLFDPKDESYLTATDAEKVEGVTSKNEALVFLKENKGAAPEVLKSLNTIKKVKQFAYKFYKVQFSTWE